MSDLTQKIAIAPMIDWTDRHYRSIMRLITKRTMLYTEMITANAIIHGPRDILLKYSPQEHPLTLQLGGSIPKDLAYCAQLAESLGYDEINLNVGCPSDRVIKGAFGLCLMKTPEIVAECVDTLKQTVKIPVSVKCRTGVDEYDSYDYLHHFIEQQVQAGVDYICIHARKGWLNGLSPKENRTIPPLNYDTVYHIKQAFPHIAIGINGGITTHEAIESHLKQVDAVMIGREAYLNPMFFAEVDHRYFGEEAKIISPFEVAEAICDYIEKEMRDDPMVKLQHISRHTLNLFNGLPRARMYRRYISENATRKDANVDTYRNALAILRS